LCFLTPNNNKISKRTALAFNRDLLPSIDLFTVDSLPLMNLFQVWVNSSEDDGEPEGEDEHGEVDDVD
jgi:hypothetical protein